MNGASTVEAAGELETGATLAPYIGPRWFGRTLEDRRRFFGRDQEIEALSGLITVEPFVVLCAESGAGKTSLCEAGLVTALEQMEFDVLPRTRVSGSVDPSVRERHGNPYVFCVLSSLFPKASATDLAGLSLEEGLAKLPIRMDSEGEPMPRLLIIDQGEEVFTFYPEGWREEDRRDFFAQVGRALRAGTRLHALFVIRDDYVAKLSGFAPLLPGELRAQFQLERLSHDQARLAVEKPVEQTARSYAKGVAERIVADLSKIRVQSETGDTREIPGPFVEPVQLQLVCDDLWRKIPADVKEVTLEHWERYGNVDQALATFYEEALRDCIAATGVDEGKLRDWFETKLITPGRTRGMAFAKGSDVAGIPRNVVDFLEQRHVVRAENRSGGRWYELTHDRLVEPVLASNAPFNARRDAEMAAELRKQRRRKAGKVAMILGATVALGGGMAAKSWINAEERRREALRQETIEAERTEGRLNALKALGDGERKAQAAGAFDAVASYLWTKKDFDKLTTLLKKYEDLIPGSYGLESSGTSAPSVDTTDWPVTLQYSSSEADAIDWARMDAQWRATAGALQQSWGIPVPVRIRFEAVNDLAPQSVRFVPSIDSQCLAAGKASPEQRHAPPPQVVRAPRKERVALLSVRSVPAQLQEFFARESPRWTQNNVLTFGGPWYYVPRWTLPLWKVAGASAASCESGLVTAIANALLHRPELIVSCDALKVALDKVAKSHPEVVAEAIRARGGLEQIRLDLVEVVRLGNPLKSLVYFLDALADHPSESASDVAAILQDELMEPVRRVAALSGPRSGAVPSLQDLRQVHPAMKEAWQPDALYPIRVYVGSNVEKQITLPGGSLTAHVKARFIAARRSLFQGQGVSVPGVTVRPAASYGETLGPDQFRIELLTQTAENEDARPQTPSGPLVEQIGGELQTRVKAVSTWWIDADSTAGTLKRLPDPQRLWLERHYSLTDLKNIKRAVVGPGTEPGATLRETGWLLGALVFWEQVGHTNDPADLGTRLRETQSARLQPSSHTVAQSPVLQHVREGIEALSKLRFDVAEASFARAARLDQHAAVEAFLARYPAEASLQKRAERLVAQCALPSFGGSKPLQKPTWLVGSETQFDVEDILDDGGTTISPAQRSALQLWLLRALSDGGDPEAIDDLIGTLLADRRSGNFSPEQEFWLGYGALVAWSTRVNPPTALQGIREVISSALTRLGKHAGSAAWQVTMALGDATTRRWFVELLEALGKEHLSQPDVALQFTGILANQSALASVRAAMEILGALERSSGEDAQRIRSNPWFALLQASALRGEAHYIAAELRPKYAEEIRRFAQLAASNATSWPTVRAKAIVAVSDSWVLAERYDLASQTIEQGLQAVPSFDELKYYRFFIDLARGDAEKMRSSVAALSEKDVAADYLRALLALLTAPVEFDGAARKFIYGANHDNQDYIRLMYAWRLRADGNVPEADRILQERFAGINRSSWPRRLVQGDQGVWREMLIGYYLDAVAVDEIRGPLASEEALARSPLHDVPMSLAALRVEFYFYDALKQQVSGPAETRERRYLEGLKRVRDTSFPLFYEYHMARYLLGKAEQTDLPRTVTPDQTGD